MKVCDSYAASLNSVKVFFSGNFVFIPNTPVQYWDNIKFIPYNILSSMLLNGTLNYVCKICLNVIDHFKMFRITAPRPAAAINW